MARVAFFALVAVVVAVTANLVLLGIATGPKDPVGTLSPRAGLVLLPTLPAAPTTTTTITIPPATTTTVTTTTTPAPAVPTPTTPDGAPAAPGRITGRVAPGRLSPNPLEPNRYRPLGRP